MRYWVGSVLGVGLFLGAVVLFNVELVALLDVGTCASGNTPYEIARPCPEGTETDALLLVASIFGLFISGGIFLARGERPGGGASGFAWPLLAWGIFFGGTGAVALIHSLTSDAVGPDAELGGIIVGVTFLVMGVPALIFLLMGVGSGHRTRETRRAIAASAAGAGPVTAPEPVAPDPPVATPDRDAGDFSRSSEQGAGSFSDDTIGRLERLQRLREAGALTPAEFEAQKERVLRGD